jgi:hypothetical protein
MKLLHTPEKCLVLLDPKAAPFGLGSLLEPNRGTRSQPPRNRVTTVRWRDRVWTVQTTLEVWVYRSEWWRETGLEGERREYHLLGTQRGEIQVFFRPGVNAGWFVAGWFD